MPDVCDFRNMMRSFFFPRDRDISLQPNRSIYLGSTNSFIYSYDGVSILLPSGPIVLMFSGAIGDIPSGWQLADGTNGTTDLRGMFIVGAGGSYSVGDTGGSDTVDISHTHTDTFSVDSDLHSHGDTLSVDSDSHSHGVTGTSASDGHTHGVGTLAAANTPSHQHSPGTLATGSPTTGAGHVVAYDSDTTLISKATYDVHTHSIDSGVTAFANEHGHTITGSTASDSHSHGDGTYAAASDSHSHTMSGSVSSDSHSHTMSGSVSTGGDTTHDNRPAFYALAFIMRPV